MQTLKHLEILVVEYSEPCSRLLEIAFTKAGHTVTLETTVKSALSALACKTYDGLICNLLFPDGNGYEIIEAVRQKEMPIFAVAITGLMPVVCEAKALTAGFNRVVYKPFKVSVLVGLFA